MITLFRTVVALPVMLLFLAGSVLVQPGAANAQTYPSKVVRVIVPFPPAGGVDIVGRVTAGRLGDALSQQFVIDNRPGASGNLGTAIASRSLPDGYTLLFFPASVVSSYVLIGKTGYNMEKDLRPISLVASAPNVLCVHPSLPVKNVKDLI